MAVRISTMLGPGLVRGSCIWAKSWRLQSWSHLATSCNGTKDSPNRRLSPNGPLSFTEKSRNKFSGLRFAGMIISNVSSKSGKSVLDFDLVLTLDWWVAPEANLCIERVENTWLMNINSALAIRHYQYVYETIKSYSLATIFTPLRTDCINFQLQGG